MVHYRTAAVEKARSKVAFSRVSVEFMQLKIKIKQKS